MKFKVGQRCLYGEEEVYVCDIQCDRYVIERSDGYGWSRDRDVPEVWVSRLSDTYYFAGEEMLRTADNNQSIMTTITEKFISAITPEPFKTFRKAGITNGDNILTDEGGRIFLAWLLQKNAGAFKTEVADGLTEEK